MAVAGVAGLGVDAAGSSKGRGSGQEASGGRGAGGHETAQGQQAQVSLDSQALLLSVVLSTG